MATNLHRQMEVVVNRRGVRRREFLRSICAGAAAAGTLSWPDLMTVQAEKLRKKGMACILLWMQGGPSQFETFSPKPSHANGGETKAISTALNGVQIAENLPAVSKIMNDLCVIRSMNSTEGSHPRASYLLHTGYIPTASIKHPSLGANVTHQLGDPKADLPGFVRIGRSRNASGGGFLGVEYDPFRIQNAAQLPQNTTIAHGQQRYRRRLRLLGRLEKHYAQQGGKQVVADHKKLYDKTSRMVLSPKMSTFDLAKEPSRVRQAYGDSAFGKGCLLARRLVQSGVTFVEVADGNWDTHFDNFGRVKTRCESIDQPFAQLITDLKQQGMLDRTMVIWMGEFGRTPRVNPRGGRDHYPRAFSVAMAGGGVKGGQVIGQTNAGGTTVVDRPVGVSDLFRTICHGMQVDADHENMSSVGRPLKIVDGGKLIKEVYG